MVGARSNLATRVYHQDTKHPGAGKLPPLPAHGLTVGQIHGALFLLTDKIFLFVESWCFPWSHCWMQTTWKSCADAVQRDMEPPCRLHSIRDHGYLHRVVLGRLWFGCSVLRHLQGFPAGPFQEVFLLQWREKPFCKLWARSNVFCSVALHPI